MRLFPQAKRTLQRVLIAELRRLELGLLKHLRHDVNDVLKKRIKAGRR